MMKRILTAVLALWMCLLAFGGCGKEFSDVTHIPVEGKKTTVAMTDALENVLLSVLEEGQWINDVTLCAHDFEFTANGDEMRYHSECGALIDVTNRRSVVLSEEQKAIVNALLGVKDDRGEGITVALARYNKVGWGVERKTIADDQMAYYIASELRSMTETGEILPEVGTGTLEDRYVYPVDVGTLWIEVDGKIYRVNPEFDQICLVDGHFGQGTVLDMSKKFAATISYVFGYHPKTVYKGTYTLETDTLEFKQVYKGNSEIFIHIVDIQVENKFRSQNTITFELISTKDQTLNINLESYQSSDNLGGSESKKVTLKKGVPQAVTMEFGGFTVWYSVDIRSESFFIDLQIDP